MSVLNHMDVVKRDDLEALLTTHDGPCISLFMPTERKGTEVQQNPIRLKNLITQAEEQLRETELSTSAQRELLAPIHTLQAGFGFWQQQSDGLAIYAAQGAFSSYRLPLALDELVIVGNRFHVKPLLPLFNRDRRFFILTLSLNRVRLYQATHYSLDEVALSGVATSIDEALQLDDPEKRLQFHTSTSAPISTGTRAAAFHGHAADEDRKVDILRFFRKVDQGVTGLLGDEQTPLLLVGVDYLHPLYQEANTYPHLADEGVYGNPETFKPEELHAHVWKIVKSDLDAECSKAAARYTALSTKGSSLMSGILGTALLAAYYGRVETLFVALDVQVWGKFDPQTGKVQLYDKPTPDNEDLLDLAAVQTIMNGGLVYVLELDEMPAITPVAAIFRY